MSRRHYVASTEITSAVRIGGPDGGGNEGGYSERAEAMGVASCSVEVDDPAGAYDFIGYKAWRCEETAAPAGNQRLFTGYLTDQDIERRDEQFGSGRHWSLSLEDTDAILHFRMVNPTEVAANRPAETDLQRLTYLLSIAPFSTMLYDEGLIDWTGGTSMDADDLRGRYLDDILGTLITASQRNCFTIYDETNDEIVLWYADDDSALYPSNAKISNVDAEADPASEWADVRDDIVWAPGSSSGDADAKSHRSPSRIYAGLKGNWSNGVVYRTRTLMLDEVFRDGEESWPEIKSATTANTQADAHLADAKTQDERITIPLWLPEAHVNDIRKGQKLGVHLTHIPAVADDFTDCRVLSRNVTPADNGGPGYDVVLEVVPIATTPPCVPGTLTPLTGDWSWDFMGGSPNYSPPDPDTVLPDIGLTAVGGSNYPSYGSPYSYARVVDRGVSPAPIAAFRFRFTLPAWTDSPIYGMTVETSDDALSWNVAIDIPTVWANRDGSSNISVNMLAPERATRYLRFVTHDWYGAPLPNWAGDGFGLVYYAECLP